MNSHCRAAGLLTVLLAAALVPAFGAAADTPPKDSDEAAIRAAGHARDGAWEAQNADGIVASYEDDAILLAPTATTSKGRAAIRKSVAGYLGKLKDGGYKLAIGSTVDVAVSGDLAYRSGTYSIKDKAGNTADTGKWLEVWHKSGGKWHIVRDISNSDMLPLFPPDAPDKASAAWPRRVESAERDQ